MQQGTVAADWKGKSEDKRWGGASCGRVVWAEITRQRQETMATGWEKGKVSKATQWPVEVERCEATRKE